MIKTIKVVICDICKTENHLKPEQISNLILVKIPVWQDDSLDCEGYIQKHIKPEIAIRELDVCPECLRKMVNLRADINDDLLWEKLEER